MWSQLKRYVARHDTTYQLPEVNQTTVDKWRHCVEHIIKKEDKLWELAHITDVVVDSLIIKKVESSDDLSLIHISSLNCKFLSLLFTSFINSCTSSMLRSQITNTSSTYIVHNFILSLYLSLIHI